MLLGTYTIETDEDGTLSSDSIDREVSTNHLLYTKFDARHWTLSAELTKFSR
jgi:hypothetical protein